MIKIFSSIHNYGWNIGFLPLFLIVSQKWALLWTSIANNSTLWKALTLPLHVTLCNPLQCYSLSHWPYGLLALTSTILVEWKTVHRLWMGDQCSECPSESILAAGGWWIALLLSLKCKYYFVIVWYIKTFWYHVEVLSRMDILTSNWICLKNLFLLVLCAGSLFCGSWMLNEMFCTNYIGFVITSNNRLTFLRSSIHVNDITRRIGIL